MSVDETNYVYPHELPYVQPLPTDLILLDQPNGDGTWTTYSTSLSALSSAGFTGPAGLSGYSGTSGYSGCLLYTSPSPRD